MDLRPGENIFRLPIKMFFIMVQVEETEAVRNLPDILSVEGIDAIFIGPADLSQSMGLTGQFDHPDFCRTVEYIICQAQKAGKPVSMFFSGVEAAKKGEEAGIKILTVSGDTILLAEAAKKINSWFTKQLRKTAGIF